MHSPGNNDGLVQDCSISIVNVLEILQSFLEITMTWCKTVVSPLPMPWIYRSFAQVYNVSVDDKISLSISNFLTINFNNFPFHDKFPTVSQKHSHIQTPFSLNKLPCWSKGLFPKSLQALPHQTSYNFNIFQCMDKIPLKFHPKISCPYIER